MPVRRRNEKETEWGGGYVWRGDAVRCGAVRCDGWRLGAREAALPKCVRACYRTEGGRVSHPGRGGFCLLMMRRGDKYQCDSRMLADRGQHSERRQILMCELQWTIDQETEGEVETSVAVTAVRLRGSRKRWGRWCASGTSVRP